MSRFTPAEQGLIDERKRALLKEINSNRVYINRKEFKKTEAERYNLKIEKSDWKKEHPNGYKPQILTV